MRFQNKPTCFCLISLRPPDGEPHAESSVPTAGVQPALPVPATGERLRRARAALHRQRGAEERGGQVQRLAAHHAESAGTDTPGYTACNRICSTWKQHVNFVLRLMRVEQILRMG